MTWVTFSALAYCLVNWLIFAVASFVSVYAEFKKPAAPASPKGIGDSMENHNLDLKDTLKGAGDLAKAFKTAGAPATAAALSLVGLIVAAISAGISK